MMKLSDGININNFKFLHETVFNTTKENFCSLSSKKWDFFKYDIYQNKKEIFCEHKKKIEQYFSSFKKLKINYVSINNISFQTLPISDYDFNNLSRLLSEINDILEKSWEIFKNFSDVFLRENVEEMNKLIGEIQQNIILIKEYKDKIEKTKKQKCSKLKNIILKIISFGCYDWNKRKNIKITSLNNEYIRLTVKNCDLKTCKEESLKQIENLNSDIKKVQNYSNSLTDNISILQLELSRNQIRKEKSVQFDNQTKGYFSRLINWSSKVIAIETCDLQNLQPPTNGL